MKNKRAIERDLLHKEMEELAKQKDFIGLERCSNAMCRIYETLHNEPKQWLSLMMISLTIFYLLAGIAVHVKDLSRSKTA